MGHVLVVLCWSGVGGEGWALFHALVAFSCCCVVCAVCMVAEGPQRSPCRVSHAEAGN